MHTAPSPLRRPTPVQPVERLHIAIGILVAVAALGTIAHLVRWAI